jgi:hypothetical protein
MPFHHRTDRLPRILALLLLAAAGLAAAQGIVVQDLRDDSSTEPDFDGPRLDLRFSSRVTTQAPTRVGDRAELQLRHVWSLGTVTDTVTSIQGFDRELGWSLTLQVHDPGQRGFELQVRSQQRGLLGAAVDTAGVASAELPGMDIWVYEMFAPTPRHLPGLSSRDARTQVINGVDRLLVDQIGSATIGRYRGTHSFLFYLAPATANTTPQSFVAGSDAYAWLQFGRGTTEPQMAFMNPGPGAPPLDTLGQFLSFRVDYAASPVPEPASWALLAAGLLFVTTQLRYRTA